MSVSMTVELRLFLGGCTKAVTAFEDLGKERHRSYLKAGIVRPRCLERRAFGEMVTMRTKVQSYAQCALSPEEKTSKILIGNGDIVGGEPCGQLGDLDASYQGYRRAGTAESQEAAGRRSVM